MDDKVQDRDSAIINSIYQVCRTCLNLTNSYCTFKVNEPSILTTCLPQINIHLTQKPVICEDCVDKLLSFHSFLMVCLQSEEKLYTYCKSNNLTPPLGLSDILTFQQSSLTVEKPEMLEVIEEKPAIIDLQDEIIENIKNLDEQSASLRDTCEEHDKKYINNTSTSQLELELQKKLNQTKTIPDVKRMIFKCDICSMTFNCGDSLQAHLQLHRNYTTTNAKPFGCDICDKSFNRKQRLLRHRGIHNAKPKPFRCKCGKRFSEEQSLKTHVEKVHNSDKPFKCTICASQYSNKKTLLRHLKFHENDKPIRVLNFMCDFCGKLFHDKSMFRRHHMIHEGVKPHECLHCNKKFSIRTSLEVHLRSHTGEKPFACSVCSYKGSSKLGLKRHMEIHNDRQLFSCKYCEKTFTRKNSLSLHIKVTHINARSHICEICNKAFNRSDYLLKHKKMHMKK